MEYILKEKYFHLIFIILFTFLIYANKFNNGFVRDDFRIIVKNDFIKDIKNIKYVFSKKYFSLTDEWQYRPVLTLTYFLNYYLFGLDLKSWHFFNIFFHSLNAILIYFIVLLILKDKLIAFLSGILFIVHPIQTETVNYITGGRDDILCFFLFLSAFLFYIKNNILLSIICFIMALFTKEMAITLPIILFAYDYFFLKDRIKNNLKKYSVYLFTVLMYLLFKFYLFKSFGTVAGIDLSNGFKYYGGNIYLSIVTGLRITVYYVYLMFFPYKLSPSIDKIFRISETAIEPSAIISLLFLSSIFFIAINNIKKDKRVSFCIFYFFITLIPVSNIIPFGNLMQEQYLYFSSFGFCLLLGILIIKIKKINIILILFSVIIMIYSLRTVLRNKDWKDDISLVEKTVYYFPKVAYTHQTLGVYYAEKKMYNEASKEFKKAIDIDNKYTNAYVGLGSVYFRMGFYEDAIKFYEEAIILPNVQNIVYYNMGLTYLKLNKKAEGRKYIKEYLELCPKDTKAKKMYNSINNEIISE